MRGGPRKAYLVCEEVRWGSNGVCEGIKEGHMVCVRGCKGVI